MESWHTVSGNVNRYSQNGKQDRLRKLKIELPYDPAIPLYIYIYIEREREREYTHIERQILFHLHIHSKIIKLIKIESRLMTDRD